MPTSSLEQCGAGVGAQRRILVVGNQGGLHDQCTLALENRSVVECVPDGEAGLERLAESSFTVTVAHERLPGIGGLEFLERACKVQPLLGRVLVCEHGQAPIVDAVNRAQVHGLLCEPLELAELAAVVARASAGAEQRLHLEFENRRFRDLVVDGRTGLPTRQVAQEEAAKWLRTSGFVGVLVIDGSELWSNQLELGSEGFASLTTQFVGLLRGMQGKCFRNDDLLVIDEVESPCFCIFLGSPREERVCCAHDVARIGGRIQEQLTRELFRQRLPVSGFWPNIAVGHGFTLFNPHVSERNQVRLVVAAARDVARRMLSDERVSRKSQLERIIIGQQISSLFQPIFGLRESSLLGYEALSRGPADTEYESPAFLLRVADRTGLTVELDRVFRATAFQNACQLPAASKIFINTLPITVCDPELQASRLGKTLERLNIDPHRVVLEFSEQYVVPNQRLLVDALREQRALGIQLAIDDVGTGYSGLERIANLEPDYLKIDQSLVRHVGTRTIKRSVLNALVRMAADIGASVIAEGIETEDELRALTDLGVPYGQGFHLGRPVPIAQCG
jgi:EAL domain-containing protein (putative c-di-GMP-specific phosphodiesterase class I)